MNRFLVWSVALLSILVGILSLFGIRPLNTRAGDIVLGTASLALGAALLLTGRRRVSTSPQALTDRSLKIRRALKSA